MAVGKNKRLTKGGKKGGKKKTGDPFLKKEWYDIKAPSMFAVRQCGKTLISKSVGTKIASEEMKGRILEVNLADLNLDEDNSFKKIRLCIEEVQGRNCLADFHGLSLTRDKECSLIRKWQTLIEAHTDVRTTDGYLVRLFVIAFTKKTPRPGQDKLLRSVGADSQNPQKDGGDHDTGSWQSAVARAREKIDP